MPGNKNGEDPVLMHRQRSSTGEELVPESTVGKVHHRVRRAHCRALSSTHSAKKRKTSADFIIFIDHDYAVAVAAFNMCRGAEEQGEQAIQASHSNSTA